MKKIAFLLIILFSTVQMAPAVMSFFAKGTPVFIADEEKSEEKVDSIDKKDKKEYANFLPHTATFTLKVNTAFHLIEKIHPSPYPENLTPPPNFC